MKNNHIKHLYWRVGFGVLPNQLMELSEKSKAEIIDNLFKESKTYTPLTLNKDKIETLMLSFKENRMEIQKMSRQKIKTLNIAWVDRLSTTNQILREKMTLFWSNHFSCKDNNYIYTENFHNTLRKHALGNFKDFVNAVSKEAAMTKYLNTKQNKKKKPNENFARELMELFTLGVGHYTESDIKESARAFTGYSHNVNGDFLLKKQQHDTGLKTFFGETGSFTGEDIIDLILKKKQCAKYVCGKIYAYFVNTKINDAHVEQMAEVFYKDYNIANLMRFVLMSNWFYEDKNIGNKIKSPIEFLVGMKTTVPFQFKNKKRLLHIENVLGQVLFNPPNVAGWKGGKSWIDSNTIILRLKLPSLLLNDAYISKIEINSNTTNAERKAMLKKRNSKQYQTNTNWQVFQSNFKNVATQDLEDYLLTCKINPEAAQYLSALKKESKREYCIQIMSLPEYQMC